MNIYQTLWYLRNTCDLPTMVRIVGDDSELRSLMKRSRSQDCILTRLLVNRLRGSHKNTFKELCLTITYLAFMFFCCFVIVYFVCCYVLLVFCYRANSTPNSQGKFYCFGLIVLTCGPFTPCSPSFPFSPSGPCWNKAIERNRG